MQKRGAIHTLDQPVFILLSPPLGVTGKTSSSLLSLQVLEGPWALSCVIQESMSLKYEPTSTGKTILIAVGGWPFVPEFPGSELAITSNEVVSQKVFIQY